MNQKPSLTDKKSTVRKWAVSRWVSISLLFLCSLSFAEGGRDSGGGNGVLCFNDPAVLQKFKKQGYLEDSDLSAVRSVKAYDLYEAELARGIPPKKPQLISVRSSETYPDYINRILQRVKYTVPELYRPLEESQLAFSDNRIIWEPFGVVPVKDASPIGSIDDSHCSLVTMASQYRTGNEDFLHIDSRLFFHDKHSELSRAVLILHEYAYRYARLKGATDSRNTRTLIGMLIRAQDDGLKLADVIQSATNLGFIPMEPHEGHLHVLAHSFPYQRTAQVYAQMVYWAGTLYSSSQWSMAEYELTGTKQYLLMEEAHKILKGHGVDPSTVQTLGHAIGELSQSVATNAELVGRIKKYQSIRIKWVFDQMKGGDWTNFDAALDFSKLRYLTDYQKAILQAATEKLYERLRKTLENTQTAGQIAALKNQSGGLSFWGDSLLIDSEDLVPPPVLAPIEARAAYFARIKEWTWSWLMQWSDANPYKLGEGFTEISFPELN